MSYTVVAVPGYLYSVSLASTFMLVEVSLSRIMLVMIHTSHFIILKSAIRTACQIVPVLSAH